MAHIPPLTQADVDTADTQLEIDWNANNKGGPVNGSVQADGSPINCLFPEQIPGVSGSPGVNSLFRKPVLFDSIFYAFAMAYYEKDLEGWKKWTLVKVSQHKYLAAALENPEHERNKLYTFMNTESKWNVTLSTRALAGDLQKSLFTNDLRKADVGTAYSIFQTMANYYDVEIVVFKTRLTTAVVNDRNKNSHKFVEVDAGTKKRIIAANRPYREFEWDLNSVASVSKPL